MSTTTLFEPLQLGELTLPNRIIMAPLTRMLTKMPGNIPWGDECRLLPAAGERRAHHFRGNARFPMWSWLFSHPRDSYGGSGKWMASRNRSLHIDSGDAVDLTAFRKLMAGMLSQRWTPETFGNVAIALTISGI